MPKKRIYEERNGILGKVCTKCDIWKSLNDYHKDGRQSSRIRSHCKECESIFRKKRYDKNSDLAREVAKRWREENKERYVEYYKNYSKQNRDILIEKNRLWREKNIEKQKAYSRVYVRENIDAFRIRNIRRRARKAGLPDDLTDFQQQEILKTFNKSCALTGDKNFNWDHVIPIATGHGGTTFGNMIPLKKELNFSKHTSNIFEWFESNRQRFDLSQDNFDNLIAFLASANAMNIEDYRDYVYWCHSNPQ